MDGRQRQETAEGDSSKRTGAFMSTDRWRECPAARLSGSQAPPGPGCGAEGVVQSGDAKRHEKSWKESETYGLWGVEKKPPV